TSKSRASRRVHTTRIRSTSSPASPRSAPHTGRSPKPSAPPRPPSRSRCSPRSPKRSRLTSPKRSSAISGNKRLRGTTKTRRHEGLKRNEIWFYPNHLFRPSCLRVFVVPLGSLNMLPSDLGPRARRLDLEVALPVRARLGAFAELLEGHGEVEMGVGEARVGLQGALEIGDRALRVAAL